MSVKFNNKYRISSIRLQKWDYGWNASYFITICTHNRQNFLGNIFSKCMKLSDIGIIAYTCWQKIPDHFPFVHLGEFIIMPNHVHGVLTINKPLCSKQPVYKQNLSNDMESMHSPGSNKNNNNRINNPSENLLLTPGNRRFQNQGICTLSSIIGSYKSVVCKHAHTTNPRFAWQSRYYDHIIQNNDSYNRISTYIINNTANWHDDRFHRNND